MPLPPKAIDEIFDLANRRRRDDEHANRRRRGDGRRQDEERPSPRGVSDLPPFDDDDHGDGAKKKKRGGRTSSSSAGGASGGGGRTPDAGVVDECASRFLKDVLSKTLAIVEHCRRMTVHPADVAKALDLFATVDAKYCDSWYLTFPAGRDDWEDKFLMMKAVMASANDDEDVDENWEDGKDEGGMDVDEEDGDEEDGDESDGEEDIDNDENLDLVRQATEEQFGLKNANAAVFFAHYPPVDASEIKRLPDKRFKEEHVMPILNEFRACLPRKPAADALLKRALYSFLVAKLAAA